MREEPKSRTQRLNVGQAQQLTQQRRALADFEATRRLMLPDSVDSENGYRHSEQRRSLTGHVSLAG